MFNPETCKRCGACVTACPFTDISVAQAKEEIVRLVDTRDSSVIMSACAGCGYCNEICPTHSNPADLRKEIRLARVAAAGAGCMSMMTDDVPENIMKVALKHNTEVKQENLKKLTHPSKSNTVFYVGCSSSYIYSDLLDTSLLDDHPMMGGMKYCCGGYIHSLFGEKEATLRGEKLLAQFNEIGIKQLITFCPECDNMVKKVYPDLVKGFDINVKSITEYILEKHENGEIEFTHPLNKKITFHDSCAWRAIDDKIYDAPRRLLECMGAEVVEMKHNRKRSLCCGAPLQAGNPKSAAMATKKRVAEAVDTGADAIAVSCNGCFALAGEAAKQNLEVYNITELIQMAIGETPPHRVKEEMKQMVNNFIATVSASPELLQKKYKIENGKLKEC